MIDQAGLLTSDQNYSDRFLNELTIANISI